MATSCILCQLNGGCMGCCGYGFPSKKQVFEAIKANNEEFRFLHPQTREELLKFRDRFPKQALRDGVCYNLISKNGQLLCPLHPFMNNGKDLREGHCEINHLCNTAIHFNSWEAEQQKEFLEFIGAKQLDNIDYSLGMDDDRWLVEFYCLKDKNKCGISK